MCQGARFVLEQYLPLDDEEEDIVSLSLSLSLSRSLRSLYVSNHGCFVGAAHTPVYNLVVRRHSTFSLITQHCLFCRSFVFVEKASITSSSKQTWLETSPDPQHHIAIIRLNLPWLLCLPRLLAYWTHNPT